MARIFKVKTTAVNSFFGFPELSIYVNQDLYDAYINASSGRIFSGTFSGIPNPNVLAEVMKDPKLTFKKRKVYYNPYLEDAYPTTDSLYDALNVAFTCVKKYAVTESDTSLLYTERSYGDLHTFTCVHPTSIYGWRVNDSLYLGNNSFYPSFGGYGGAVNLGSNTQDYSGCRYTLYFNVFPENILNDDNQLQIQGSCLKFSIAVNDNIKASGSFSITVRFEAIENVASLQSASLFSGVTPIEDTGDPYQEGGTTTTGGGQGTFDGSSDTISVPGLPSKSALSSGFITMYNPTLAQLKSLRDYMWSDAFSLDSFKKIFANPIDAIMGFALAPIAPVTDVTSIIHIGNISTGISMREVSQQYYELDCGTISIPEYFGSYLDYEPYTTFSLYLPYIGSVPIDTDDIKKNNTSGTINVKYHIDILSGAVVAYVVVNGTVGYQFTGSCLTQLPITGNDFRNMFQSIVNLASTVVGGLATGSLAGTAGAVLGNAGNVASNVANMKPDISRSGTMSSSAGLMGVQVPYLIINMPIEAVAWAQNAYQGYPAHISSSVKDVSGYSEWEKIYFDGVPATDPEINELQEIFAKGVIL